MSEFDGSETMIGDVSSEIVSIQSACARTIEADSVEMEQAGAGLIVAADSASLHQSGACAIIADGEAKLVQSGACVVVANEAEVTQGFVGVLAANEVELGPDTKVLATWREAVIFGAVFGVVAALVDVAFRGFRRGR